MNILKLRRGLMATIQHATNTNGKSFFDRHFGSVLMIIVLFVGQVAEYAILQSRVAALEDRSRDFITQAEYKDISRRIEVLETELVPRSEHLLRDAELNKRLDGIQDSLTRLEDRLNLLPPVVLKK